MLPAISTPRPAAVSTRLGEAAIATSPRAMQVESARGRLQRRPLHPDIVAKQAAGVVLLQARKEQALGLVRERELAKARRRDQARLLRRQQVRRRAEAAAALQAVQRGRMARHEAEGARAGAREQAALLLQARFRGEVVRNDAVLRSHADEREQAKLRALRDQARAIIDHNSWFIETQLRQRLDALEEKARAEGARKATELLRDLRASHALRVALESGDTEAARWAAAIVVQRAWVRHMQRRAAREEALQEESRRLALAADAARAAMRAEHASEAQQPRSGRRASTPLHSSRTPRSFRRDGAAKRRDGELMPMNRPALHMKRASASESTPSVSSLVREASVVGLRSVLDQHCSRVIDIFRKLDTDGSGRVDMGEFKATLPLLLGLEASETTLHDVDVLFHSLDRDGSGTVEYEELHQLLRKGARMELAPELRTGARGEIELRSQNSISLRQAPKRHGNAVTVAELRRALSNGCSKLVALFAACDSNADGKVSQGEFRAALPLLGFDVALGWEACDQVFAQLDVDASGSLDYAEMDMVLLRTASPTNENAAPAAVPTAAPEQVAAEESSAVFVHLADI